MSAKEMPKVWHQQCKVCGEVAAGFHFGVFTCEGCKSFFGRSYNSATSLGECKSGGSCTINRKTRTSCKSCRLKKCLGVGMSKSGSRYGRRSNWFKLNYLMKSKEQSKAEDAGNTDSQTATEETNASGHCIERRSENLKKRKVVEHLDPTTSKRKSSSVNNALFNSNIHLLNNPINHENYAPIPNVSHSLLRPILPPLNIPLIYDQLFPQNIFLHYRSLLLPDLSISSSKSSALSINNFLLNKSNNNNLPNNYAFNIEERLDKKHINAEENDLDESSEISMSLPKTSAIVVANSDIPIDLSTTARKCVLSKKS